MKCICGLDDSHSLPDKYDAPPVVSCSLPGGKVKSICHVCGAQSENARGLTHKENCHYVLYLKRNNITESGLMKQLIDNL